MKGRGVWTTDGDFVWMHREEEAAAICGRCTQLRLDLGVSAESQTARTSGKYPAKKLLVRCIPFPSGNLKQAFQRLWQDRGIKFTNRGSHVNTDASDHMALFSFPKHISDIDYHCRRQYHAKTLSLSLFLSLSSLEDEFPFPSTCE